MVDLCKQIWDAILVSVVFQMRLSWTYRPVVSLFVHCFVRQRQLWPPPCELLADTKKFRVDLLNLAVGLFQARESSNGNTTFPAYSTPSLARTTSCGLQTIWLACVIRIIQQWADWERKTAQQTRDVEPMLVWCWAIVSDAGPTSTQHWFNVSCLLGDGY